MMLHFFEGNLLWGTLIHPLKSDPHQSWKTSKKDSQRHENLDASSMSGLHFTWALYLVGYSSAL